MKIGFLGLLTIVFIVLKLTEVIAWSWWLVLMPLYIIPVIILGGFLLALLGLIGAELVSPSKKKK